MSRHRTPTSQLEQSGSFDHDPQRRDLRENEPVPDGPLGDPPEYMDPAEKAIWDELAGKAAPGVLTVSDRFVMELVCRDFARHRAGEVLKAAEKNFVLSCLARMGFTPADRSRINAPTPNSEKSQSTFSKLANSGRGELKQ